MFWLFCECDFSAAPSPGESNILCPGSPAHYVSIHGRNPSRECSKKVGSVQTVYEYKPGSFSFMWSQDLSEASVQGWQGGNTGQTQSPQEEVSKLTE